MAVSMRYFIRIILNKNCSYLLSPYGIREVLVEENLSKKEYELILKLYFLFSRRGL